MHVHAHFASHNMHCMPRHAQSMENQGLQTTTAAKKALCQVLLHTRRSETSCPYGPRAWKAASTNSAKASLPNTARTPAASNGSSYMCCVRQGIFSAKGRSHDSTAHNEHNTMLWYVSIMSRQYTIPCSTPYHHNAYRMHNAHKTRYRYSPTPQHPLYQESAWQGEKTTCA